MSVPVKKWDVVLLAYPFSDLSASKVRPAVVISPDIENGVLEDAVFLTITSNTKRLSRFDLGISSSDPEFASTGLLRDSTVRVNKVWTLKQTLVRRVLGTFAAGLRQRVTEGLGRFLELPRR